MTDWNKLRAMAVLELFDAIKRAEGQSQHKSIQELNAQKRASLALYAPAMEAFKQFCISTESEPEEWEEVDFSDLSVGFFIALGVPNAAANDLALIARYDFHYWSD